MWRFPDDPPPRTFPAECGEVSRTLVNVDVLTREVSGENSPLLVSHLLSCGHCSDKLSLFLRQYQSNILRLLAERAVAEEVQEMRGGEGPAFYLLRRLALMITNR